MNNDIRRLLTVFESISSANQQSPGSANNSHGKMSTLSDDFKNTIPGLSVYPTMSYYDLYRLGIALASLPERPEGEKVGPARDAPLTMAYTKEEQDMLNLAKKMMGFPSKEITSPGSEEFDEVNSVSPYRKNLKDIKKGT